MNYRVITSLTLCLLVAASMPAVAQWSTQQTLATNAYNGTVTIDSSGNLVSTWYQNSVNAVYGSTASFGQPWSAPVNISGNIGVASGNPVVRGSATGNATVTYASPALGGTFADHPSGGSWTAPAADNGVNQFFVINDNGDQGVAWGTGGARGTSSTVNAVTRPAHGVWSAATTIASAAHLAFDGALELADGSTAVAWETFDSTCGSRTCKTSNWVLKVSTHAPGAQSWVTSGALLGPDASQHFGQLASDSAGDLGVASIQNGNIVSVVRHNGTWGSAAVVAPLTSLGYSASNTDNRIFHSDSSGHATIVGFGNQQVTNIAAVDGNLATNTWGTPAIISGADQYPNYFDFAESSSGTAIVFYALVNLSGSTTTWRAITRKGAGQAWNGPATAGTSFDAGGQPDSAAVNSAGRAAVVFHGYSSDFLNNILYTNTFQP